MEDSGSAQNLDAIPRKEIIRLAVGELEKISARKI